MKTLILSLSLLIGFSAHAAEFTISVNKVGNIVASSLPACPSGTLTANGQMVSKAAYAKLYAAMGEAYGPSNETQFTLPNYSGQFLRGGGSNTVDPDFGSRPDVDFPGMASGTNVGKIGSVQADEFKSHNHNGGANMYGINVGQGGNRDISNGSYSYAQMQNAGGNETRPKNMAVQYCISY